MEDCGAILDFGCGCGRVLRYWKSLNGTRLYRTDYNPALIERCQSKLGGFVVFKTNYLVPFRGMIDQG